MTTETDTTPCVIAGEHQITQRHGLHECPENGLETEEGEGMALVAQLVGASMDANFRTMGSLYEREREHRMALEVLLDIALDAFDEAHMGTVRQYEDAVNILRFKSIRGDFHGGNWIHELAKRHPEITEHS